MAGINIGLTLLENHNHEVLSDIFRVISSVLIKKQLQCVLLAVQCMNIICDAYKLTGRHKNGATTVEYLTRRRLVTIPNPSRFLLPFPQLCGKVVVLNIPKTSVDQCDR